MARFRIVPDKSAVLIEASSSLHPIHTRTVGLEGFLDVDVHDGVIDTSADPKAELSLRVEQLSSGNRLEDRELQRRIDARRHPTIDGRLDHMSKVNGDGRYRVAGDLTFHGVTRRCEDELVITADRRPHARVSRASRRSTSATSGWSRRASSCCASIPT